MHLVEKRNFMRLHAGYVPYITICVIIGFHYLQRLRLSATRIFQNIRTLLHLGDALDTRARFYKAQCTLAGRYNTFSIMRFSISDRLFETILKTTLPATKIKNKNPQTQQTVQLFFANSRIPFTNAKS